MRSAVASPRRPVTAVGIVVMLLWTVLPASVAWAQQGPPDHAGEAQRPAHSETPGQPDHARNEAERSTPPAADESRNETAPNRAPRAEEVRDGQQGEQARSEAPGQAQRNEGTSQRPENPGSQAPGRVNQPDDRGEQVGERGDAGTPNRGTVKVRTTGDETWPPRTEPHVGCEFWLHFHGFDAGERAFTLLAWSPTGDQQPVYRGTVSLSDARGNAYSGIYPPDPSQGLTLDALTLDPNWPAGYEPHDQRGWHLRLEVDGPKHKMFWVDCAFDPLDAEPTEEVLGDSNEVEGNSNAAEGTSAERFGIGGGDPEDEAAVLGVILSNSGDVFGIGGATTSSDSDARILGAPVATGDSALPVTGGQLLWLAAIGLLLAATGTRLVTTRGAEQG